MSNNTNCKNVEACYSCYSCDSCNYCNSCYSCYSCDSCNYCNSCYSCYSCYSCDSCNYCNSCNSCYSCDSCNYCNSCYASSGLRMSERMIFCLGEGKYKTRGAGYQKNNCIFNVQVTEDEWDKAEATLPKLDIAITKWIDKDDMTAKEKKEVSVWKETGGYLKRFGYQEAWGIWWNEASEKDRQAILDLPHFDKDIFKEITGIDVEAKDSVEQEALKLLKSKGYKIVKENK